MKRKEIYPGLVEWTAEESDFRMTVEVREIKGNPGYPSWQALRVIWPVGVGFPLEFQEYFKGRFPMDRWAKPDRWDESPPWEDRLGKTFDPELRWVKKPETKAIRSGAAQVLAEAQAEVYREAALSTFVRKLNEKLRGTYDDTLNRFLNGFASFDGWDGHEAKDLETIKGFDGQIAELQDSINELRKARRAFRGRMTADAIDECIADEGLKALAKQRLEEKMGRQEGRALVSRRG